MSASTTAASPTTEALQRVKATSQRPSGGTAPEGSVSLAMGEPDFPPPAAVVEATSRALAQGWTHYGDLNGDPELRQLIAELTSAQAVRPLGSDQVSITHGATGALTAAIIALVNSGDRVVIPEPTYSLYADLVHLVGGTPVFVPLRDDHHLDVERTVAAAADAALVIVCNPGNPTGRVIGAADLGRLGARLPDGVRVLVDEAYSSYVYGGNFASAVSIAALRDRLVLVNTFSKTYAMTGFRLGYSIASPETAADISLAHRSINGAVNAAIQRAGITAIRDTHDDVARMLGEYDRRRALMVQRLRAIPGISFNEPEGAFYVFIRYNRADRSIDLAARLREAGVLVRAGSEYGPSGEGHLRLSFTSSGADLERGLDRLEAVLSAP